MGITFIKISAVYFVIGVLLGYYMSVTHSYQFAGVHVHINLLGWTSMTLAGIIYTLFPQTQRSILGKIHFWLHNIGLPVMMIGLFFLIQGNETIGTLIPFGATAVLLAVITFALNVFMNLK
ncbi:cytochrome-c oxidase [Halalkalibacter nanhaiisediminis]|uniref:Cytochrome C and Quinol oxidase polypeptide I n=1 Tax=Halalkalibacter nanhaiisediminis TaxID=688079 RepID=A0A562QR09_9BACI|nr:cytochrome-c oxidase [Halalkalibacter nanhaiisediminis]TWI59189.1 Cytochrome C and Quinol oxidase polypeptide I [Halalkalibacter nanhaiisediminis]